MRNETKRRTLHYKLAVMPKAKNTLQEMLETVVLNNGSLKKASDREESISSSDDSFRLLNDPVKHRGMFCAKLMLWEKNQSHSAITIDKSATSYSVRTIQPSDLQKQSIAQAQKEEFLESILHFGVLGNHMVIMSSASLTARQLETHLTWLLGTQSKHLPDDGIFSLSDKPTVEAIKKLEKSPAKKVILGAPITAQPKEENEGTTSNSVKSIQFVPAGITGELISAVFKNLGAPVPKLDDALDEANLKLKLEVTYLRQTTKSGQQFLDELSTSMRHAHEDDVVVDLSNGAQLKGKDLKLSTNINVQFNNGAIDENELYHAMHDWLSHLISEAKIE
ncbi:hypothetical protein P8629_01480 [Hydrogenovibrio sp. 3SP14C1]|uniref:hypothetical protein n=1 Tax=Hydrogenovibrio sp. 3SP14C1 TaxID=3038774 RepID=UPI0024166D8D|nr:hypothetical protein [Hydrogenovibrio sp. 3SP14C1]MDG4811667.1 hypothetical protein [Hydrogenovibrio sp. 3SP14C1]